MKQKGLSPSQASIVVAMRSGYRLHFIGHNHTHCYLSNAAKQGVTFSALALERAGYIKRVSLGENSGEFRFTKKGNALP